MHKYRIQQQLFSEEDDSFTGRLKTVAVINNGRQQGHPNQTQVSIKPSSDGSNNLGDDRVVGSVANNRHNTNPKINNNNNNNIVARTNYDNTMMASSLRLPIPAAAAVALPSFNFDAPASKIRYYGSGGDDEEDGDEVNDDHVINQDVIASPPPPPEKPSYHRTHVIRSGRSYATSNGSIDISIGIPNNAAAATTGNNSRHNSNNNKNNGQVEGHDDLDYEYRRNANNIANVNPSRKNGINGFHDHEHEDDVDVSNNNGNKNPSSNSNNKLMNNDIGTSDSKSEMGSLTAQEDSGGTAGKPESTRKMPYFYCKTLGWDPTLNKFHIQLDMLDANVKDSGSVSSQPSTIPTVVNNNNINKSLIAADIFKPVLEKPVTVERSNPAPVRDPERDKQHHHNHNPKTGNDGNQNSNNIDGSNARLVPEGNTNVQRSESQKKASSPPVAAVVGERIGVDIGSHSPSEKSSSTSKMTESDSGADGKVGRRGSNDNGETKRDSPPTRPTSSVKEREKETPVQFIQPALPPSSHPPDDERLQFHAGSDCQDEDNPLVIDASSGRKESLEESQKEKMEEDNGESSPRDSAVQLTILRERLENAGEKEKEKETDKDDATVKVASPSSPFPVPEKEERRKSSNSSNSQEGNEDFRCQVCHKMFLSDEEVNEHFTTEHFRPVGASILEPPSPFPTITVEGTSSIFEDEVEEPEPFPVETQLTVSDDATELSNLLRRTSAEEREARNQAHIVHPQFRLPMATVQQSIHGGRGLPPPATRMYHAEHRPMVTQSGLYRPAGPHFPTALHQALVRHHGPPPPQQPPPRPQLRPMPVIQMRGGTGTIQQSQSFPSRPPLTRVPPAAQLGNVGIASRHPQSILRPNIAPAPGPGSGPAQGPTQAPAQRMSIESEDITRMQRRLTEIEQQIRWIDQQFPAAENNPTLRQHLIQKKEEWVQQHRAIVNHIREIQSQQLRRQQMIQQNAANLQQQQQRLRQQQLQQARANASASEIAAAIQQQYNRQNAELLNAGVKRHAGGPMTEGPYSKQPRMEALSIVAQDKHENARMPNAVTIRPIIPQQAHHPQHSPQHQLVEPGMHSGGSTGSRHSSTGSTPPIIPSPVAQRLANNGISLTPAAAHSPLNPLSPPPNPNLSPISDSSASPRGSPRIQNLSTMSNHSSSPGSRPQSNGSSGNFVAPHPPKENIVTNPNAERPERPPTIDLTDDEVQIHNAQMRATGGGAVTQEQIQLHEVAKRGNLNIPGTSQFTIRPVTHNPPPAQAHAPKPVTCSPCNATFSSSEALAEHIQLVHRQPPQQGFRAPQPGVLRRTSPGVNMPHIRQNVVVAPPPPPLRPPAQTQARERGPAPASIVARHQDHRSPQRRGSTEEYKNLAIPLLYLDRLDSNRIRALNEMGVTSFIPLEGLRSLGIPMLGLRPNQSLGHFPHDTAMEIGASIQLLPSPDSVRPPPQLPPQQQQQQQQQIIRRTPPSNIQIPNHAAAHAPPSVHPHPPSVISPPMGTTCTMCPSDSIIRRPSPTSVIHHHHYPSAQASNPQITVRAIHPNSQFQRAAPAHHESFLGGQGQAQFGGNRN